MRNTPEVDYKTSWSHVATGWAEFSFRDGRIRLYFPLSADPGDRKPRSMHAPYVRAPLTRVSHRCPPVWQTTGEPPGLIPIHQS